MEFSLNDIQKIYATTKTGADFPRLANELRKIGVVSYSFTVKNGGCVYYDSNGDELISKDKYQELTINKIPQPSKLQHALKIHQAGKSDFPTFCKEAASSGVSNWKVDLDGMTVAYYSIDGNSILMENIPLFDQ